jgi:hypothetical protein
MRARSFECCQPSPTSEQEIKQREKRLYLETGKGLVHPNEFAEVYVRDEVQKHLDRKYKGVK